MEEFGLRSGRLGSTAFQQLVSLPFNTSNTGVSDSLFLDQNNVSGTHTDNSDIELGLPRENTSNSLGHEAAPENRMRLMPLSDAADPRLAVQEVIGEALAVFSRLLRTHD